MPRIARQSACVAPKLVAAGRSALRRRSASPRCSPIGGGTAYATGTLARAADSLAAVFGAGPAQTELIDRIGRPIGASCTSNGITITADAIIGMRHAYAVVYTIEKDDGTAFDEITMNENGHYNLFLEGGGNINALTALRLGVQGGHGGAYTFDADPSDNAIQLMEMMSLTGTDASLSGETLHFDAIKLLYMPTSADGQRDLPVETIATGDWNMSFKIDYDDLSVDLPAGQSFTVNGHNAVVDELAISPLGATITYTVDAVDGPSEPTGLETNSESRARLRQLQRDLHRRHHQEEIGAATGPGGRAAKPSCRRPTFSTRSAMSTT